MTVLMIAMVTDFITGLIVSGLNKSKKTPQGGLDSNIGAKGILKKVLIIIAVFEGVLVDKALGTDQMMFRDMIAWFYVANETLSVLENLALADVPVPKKLKEFLEQTKDKADKGEGKE